MWITKLKGYGSMLLVVFAVTGSAGLYFAWQRAEAKYQVAVTARVRLAAELSGIVKEAERVKRIMDVDIPVEAGAVLKAGAEATARVEAKVETRGESVGSATVEETPEAEAVLQEQERGGRSGTLTLTDEHERFTAKARYSYTRGAAMGTSRGSLDISEVNFTTHQIFTIETIEFSQRVVGETAWRGYSVSLTERSPKTGQEVARYTIPHADIDASYVPAKGHKRWAFVTEAGFSYLVNDGNPGFYGRVGLRIKRLEAKVGLTDEDVQLTAGWRKEW